MKMLQGIPMGVLTRYQGALDTWSFIVLYFIVLNSYFIDFRKCMKCPLHFFFFSTGSCIFGTLDIIIVYAVIVMIA